MSSRIRTLVLAGSAIVGGCSAEPADQLRDVEVVIEAVGARPKAESGRVTVCHVSEDGGSQAITVAAAAIAAHLRHGDTLGECASGCTGDGECSDGNACTSDDCLADGTCAHTPVQCDDGDPCTIDACASDLGCTTAPASNVTCNDGNDCTAADVCSSGVCRGAPISGCCQSAADCDDGNGCSVDACVSSACVNTPLDCAVPDACVVGYCDPTLSACGSTPVTCDDGNFCTDDSCDPRLGCQSRPTSQPPEASEVSCADRLDNDCDGLADSEDSDCPPLHACDAQPCRNGGTCANSGTGYVCTCAPGYAGTDCELDVNDCATAPCMNGGVCVDGVNGYTCLCPDGFVGTDCNVNIGVPSGAYSISPSPTKNCAFGLVSFSLSTLVFSSSGSVLTVSGAPCVMTSTAASGGTFTVDCMLPGSCDETYSLTGTFTGPHTWTGTFAADFTPHGAGACFDCSDQAWTVAGAR